jgi:glyoxylase-like metal-dependent hydrolase (beta-lactamase superfamily II)
MAMATLPEPRPAELPLQGGREGATVRVHPLKVAEELAPPQFYDGALSRTTLLRALVTPRSQWVRLPMPAFLLEHPEAGPILVDTAFDATVATDRVANLGRGHAAIHQPKMEPEDAVPGQLRARGVDPADVKLVVMSHLHYDHASGAGQFPGATFVCTGREWAAASKGGVMQGYHPPHLVDSVDWRTFDFPDPEAGFDSPVDLLGDGSIRLVSTPGHTDGHVSVLVRIAGGELLLVGDAAYSRKTIDERLVPLYLTGSRRDYERSLDQIAGYVEAHPDAVVICDHDTWSWPTLEPVY